MLRWLGRFLRRAGEWQELGPTVWGRFARFGGRCVALVVQHGYGSEARYEYFTGAPNGWTGRELTVAQRKADIGLRAGGWVLA